ncbi:hypothetical protein BH23VER1_BH23VER1_10670 [soil metagenome]
MPPSTVDVSVVLPCLNEAANLAGVLEEVSAALVAMGPVSSETVVADNGSTDGSARIAAAAGARVVAEPERGYGAALRAGIAAARGVHVIMVDADGTYRYSDIAAVYRRALETGADLVLAPRSGEGVERGSIPFFHRALGTPLLTGALNALYGRSLTDVNTGFRCLRRDAFLGWGCRGTGMEFASEMIVRASLAGTTIEEVPTGLRVPASPRPSHLHTWRDGMRHLIVILAHRPKVFEVSGLAALAATSAGQAAAIALGPSTLGSAEVFGIHTRLLLLVGGIFGGEIYALGCLLFRGGQGRQGREGREGRPGAAARWAIGLGGAEILLVTLTSFALLAAAFGGTVAHWAWSEFHGIHVAPQLVTMLHFTVIPALFGFTLLAGRLVERDP